MLVIANNNLGTSLSGGDQIFLNIIKYWQRYFRISVLGSAETSRLIKDFGLDIPVIVTDTPARHHTPNTFQLLLHQTKRLIRGINCLRRQPDLISTDYVYTASDFIPDLFLGFIIRLFHPKSYWIAGYYLFAPNPFSRRSPYNLSHRPIKGLFYYLSQIPTHFLARNFADFVLVTSLPDTKRFPKHLRQNKVSVIQGGVYIPNFATLKRSFETNPPSTRQFDACFLGRLHVQKGIVELIDIWKQVVAQKPNARLLVIGDGDLAKTVSHKIKTLDLVNNVKMVGFQTGRSKYGLFKNSRVVVHPAIYDSGGMAAAEAMAWGLPAVSFDLPALKSYYPKGMIKTPCFDLTLFAKNILSLINNRQLYQRYSRQARELIEQNWSWQKRTNDIYRQIISSTNE